MLSSNTTVPKTNRMWEIYIYSSCLILEKIKQKQTPPRCTALCIWTSTYLSLLFCRFHAPWKAACQEWYDAHPFMVFVSFALRSTEPSPFPMSAIMNHNFWTHPWDGNILPTQTSMRAYAALTSESFCLHSHAPEVLWRTCRAATIPVCFWTNIDARHPFLHALMAAPNEAPSACKPWTCKDKRTLVGWYVSRQWAMSHLYSTCTRLSLTPWLLAVIFSTTKNHFDERLNAQTCRNANQCKVTS